MKKLILICLLSLLSATSLFGGYKEKLRTAAAKAQQFVDRNLNSEKVDATLDKIKEAVTHTFDKTEESIENIDRAKIEASLEKAAEVVMHASDKVKEFINNIDLSEPETSKAEETTKAACTKAGQHMHHLKFSRIDTILTNFEETVMDAFDNAKKYMLHLDLATLAVSSKNAKNNINSFVEKHAIVIEHLRAANNYPDAFYLLTNLKASTKPEDFAMTDLEYTNMCNNYNLFITSGMYLTVLQDIALHGKSDCINSMGKKYYMLNQLADLMEIQSSDLNKRTKCSEEAFL